jgi:hypothetical protein
LFFHSSHSPGSDAKSSEIAALTKKLEIFQARCDKMEEERAARDLATKSDDLQRKIWKMEERLDRATKRKSTVILQEHMQRLEAEIQNARQGPNGNGANSASNERVALLEKKMAELQNAPVVVNDAETRQMQSYIKQLEAKMKENDRVAKGRTVVIVVSFLLFFLSFFFLLLFFLLIEQMQRAELERRAAQKRKEDQEESLRINNQKREQLFISQMEQMEARLRATEEQRRQERERTLGAGGNDETIAHMKALEQRLVDAERALIKKRGTIRVVCLFVWYFFFFRC